MESYTKVIPVFYELSLAAALLFSVPAAIYLLRQSRTPTCPPSCRMAVASGAIGLALATLLVWGRLLPQPSARSIPVTLEMTSVAHDPPGRQTYYLIAVQNSKGRTLLSAKQLAESAAVLEGGALLGGHGIWSDLPANGPRFRLEWHGHLQVAPGEELYLLAGSAVKGTLLEVSVCPNRSQILDFAQPGAARSNPQLLPLGQPAAVPITKQILQILLLALPLSLLAMAYLWRESQWPAVRMEAPPESQRKRYDLWLYVGMTTVIFLFSLPAVTADFLWHDDGAWYYEASQHGWGLLARTRATQASVCWLSPFRNFLYSIAMVTWGLPVARSIVVALMATSTVLAFHFYRKALGWKSEWALLAATLPNLLPSLKGIPVGLNASYAVFTLMPFFGCLLFLHWGLRQRPLRALIGLTLALCLFACTLEMSIAGVFLTPCAILLLLFHLRDAPQRALGWSVPFLLYGINQAVSQAVTGSKQITPVDLYSFLERVLAFLSMGTIFPYARPVAPWLGTLLVSLGLLLCVKIVLRPGRSGLSAWPTSRPWLTLLWIIVWMGANAYAYVAASSTFRPYDYAYVFNYGAVLAQVVFFAVAASWIASRFRLPRAPSLFSAAPIAGALLLIYGLARLFELNQAYRCLNNGSAFLRRELSRIHCKENAQIVVCGMDGPFNQHWGNRQVNSGYLRYLLGRNDVTGLIGADFFPNDPFRLPTSWFDRMAGLSTNQPLVLLCKTNDRLRSVSHLMQTRRTPANQPAELYWSLYRTTPDSAAPALLSEGYGMASYHAFATQTNTPFTVLFGPGEEMCEHFVPPDHVAHWMTKENLLERPIEIESFLTLAYLGAASTASGPHWLLLLHWREKPPELFRLAYTLNGRTVRVHLGMHARAGDYLLVRTAPQPHPISLTDTDLNITNAGAWPYRQIASVLPAEPFGRVRQRHPDKRTSLFPFRYVWSVEQ